MQPTYTHKNQEARQESPKVHNRITRTLNEIIRIPTVAAYPVRQRCNNICRDD